MRFAATVFVALIICAQSSLASGEDDQKKVSCADYCARACQMAPDKNKCLTDCPRNCASRRGEVK